MVGFCSCFSPSSTKYDDPVVDNADHAACHVVQMRHQAPAVHAAANHKASAYTTDYDHSNYDDQMQTDEYAPTATDVTSHQISISPERPHAASTDGSELVVDVVRQDNLDNGKPISPTKVVPAEQFQFAQRTSESDINPAAAAATDAASWPFDDGSRSKSVKTPGSAGKIARTNSTPGKRAPWGSRGAAAAQITPEKTQSAKYTPNTSSGGLSPSVFRPTCSSNARAQAVSVNKAANSASGTWKF